MSRNKDNQSLLAMIELPTDGQAPRAGQVPDLTASFEPALPRVPLSLVMLPAEIGASTSARVAYLASLGCRQIDIAMILRIPAKLLEDEFAAAFQEGDARYRYGLRKRLSDAADDAGPATLAGLLAKHDAETAALKRAEPAAIAVPRPFRQYSDHQFAHLLHGDSQQEDEDQFAWELELRILESNFAMFFRAAWEALYPGRDLVWSWHYDLLCEWLTMVKRREARRLIVNVPPRTAKSTLATICFPIWTWLSDPKHNFLCASYSRELSTDHSVLRRQLLNSEWFQKRWGADFHVGDGQDLKTQFDNDKGGQMIATSVGATVTGRGGDTLIVDDPLSAPQALSAAERNGANAWFDNTLRSRLNDPATGAIVVIMQRLHEMDLTGYLLECEPYIWTHLRIPLVEDGDEPEAASTKSPEDAEEFSPERSEAESGADASALVESCKEGRRGRRYAFPVSQGAHFREHGDVLQPDRFTPEVVESLRERSLLFAGQYQQRPAPLEGNLIKRSQIRYYGGVDPATGALDEPLPETFDREIISVDCAFKDHADSDYVAIGRIGVKGSKRYLLNVINAHLGMRGTEEAIRGELAGRRIAAVLIEDTANGTAIVERLKANVSGVIAVNPEGGKLARFMAMQPEWEAGDWYVSRTAGWLPEFIQQLVTFPAAQHDDMCDMLSQASIWLQKPVTGPEAWLQYWREENERQLKRRGTPTPFWDGERFW